LVASGGSIYWVIRGQTRVRQLVTGFRSERDEDEKGRAYCLIEVDPHLVPTLWRPWRPFQGWRYLKPVDAPPDAPEGVRGDAADDALPSRMIAELRALGLW